MSTALRAVLGAAGVDTGGGGGSCAGSNGFTSFTSTGSAATSNQRGTWFTKVNTEDCVGLSVYLGAAQSVTLRLWRVSDETLLGSVVVTSETDAWVDGCFASAVSLSDGVDYVATVHAGGSNYQQEQSSSGNYTVDSSVMTYNGFANGAGTGWPGVSSSTTVLGAVDIIVA